MFKSQFDIELYFVGQVIRCLYSYSFISTNRKYWMCDDRNGW